MTEVSYTTMAEIKNLVNEIIGNKFGLKVLAPVIKIEFNNRFHSRLGDANYMQQRIRFSAPLWERASVEERRQVIIHEACHIVASHMFMSGQTKDRSAHGPCWKKCMIMCGVSPDRCHTVPTKGLRERIEAACDCKSWEITKNRATLMQRGKTYICQSCRGPLRLRAVY